MIKVELHGNDFKISKQIDDFTQEKFAGLDKYLNDAKSVKVTVQHEARQYKVSAEVSHEHLDAVHAQATEDTVYEAIKHCSELVRKQLRRRHNKIADHHKD